MGEGYATKTWRFFIRVQVLTKTKRIKHLLIGILLTSIGVSNF